MIVCLCGLTGNYHPSSLLSSGLLKVQCFHVVGPCRCREDKRM